MTCECTDVDARAQNQRRVVKAALALNALLFFVGLGAGLYAGSTGILADALDMLCDASGYALALLAIGRSAHFKRLSARWTGWTLALLGVLIIAEAVRRWIMGNQPLGLVMAAYSVLSLCVNVYVMTRLAKVREGGVHLNASYLCTRADVLANIALLVSGILVWSTGLSMLDPLVGTGIALLVFREAREILGDAAG